jgi:voltage-gated potassium channel Kch
MSENRREQDRSVAPVKGPIDRLGDALKPDGTQIEIPDVRSSDLEPYVGLRYLSKLFKLMGVILGLLLLAEVITGLTNQGTDAVPVLLGEASRLIVLAGLLWGVGDLAILLIDVGHDVRAARILLARQTHATLGVLRRSEPPNGVVAASAESVSAMPASADGSV